MPTESVPSPAHGRTTPRRALLRASVAGALTALAASPAHAAGYAPRPLPAPRARQAPQTQILACDQASQSVLLLDATSAYWRSGGFDGLARVADLVPLWSWSPVDDPALDDLDTSTAWQNVSEAKARFPATGPLLLTCASGGLVAAVHRNDSTVYWATALPSGSNPHSVELLPDGNIAVAASTGGFVRVYTASQGDRSDVYAEFALPDAHGLFWDGTSGLLWALGDTRLVGLAVDGTAANPRLTAARTVALPESGGHDLAKAVGAEGGLWVSTSSHVRRLSVRDGLFVPYRDQGGIDRPTVKSVSQNPVTGQVLTVSPGAGSPCAWCTSHIRFHGPGGEEELKGSSLYKARWWTADAP
ncbi:DUF6528 family protein [Streptomyces sp. NPDC048696]|uniref:DUF6528 family protein n=1 Tax=Streptomyces sp. NPDC048696 TaxID=3365585 RepID=UPI003722FDE3